MEFEALIKLIKIKLIKTCRQIKKKLLHKNDRMS